MKLHTIFLMLMLASKVQKGSTTVLCESGWSRFRDACYKFSNEKKDWNDAEEACKLFGGHLTSIHSKAEADFIRVHVDQSSYDNTWIGGYKRGNAFQWIDGSTFDFKYWDANEPNNKGGVEKCIEIRETSDKWNDKRCRYTLQNFICKKQKDSNELCKFVRQQSCTNDYVKTNCPDTCSGMKGMYNYWCISFTEYFDVLFIFPISYLSESSYVTSI